MFRTKLVLFSMGALFVVNVVLLVIGPIVTIALLAFVVVATKKSESKPCAPHNHHAGADVSQLNVLQRTSCPWTNGTESSRPAE